MHFSFQGVAKNGASSNHGFSIFLTIFVRFGYFLTKMSGLFIVVKKKYDNDDNDDNNDNNDNNDDDDDDHDNGQNSS